MDPATMKCQRTQSQGYVHHFADGFTANLAESILAWPSGFKPGVQLSDPRLQHAGPSLLLVLQRLHRLVGIPYCSQIFESLQVWDRGIASRRRRRLVSKQMIVLTRSIPFKPSARFRRCTMSATGRTSTQVAA